MDLKFNRSPDELRPLLDNKEKGYHRLFVFTRRGGGGQFHIFFEIWGWFSLVIISRRTGEFAISNSPSHRSTYSKHNYTKHERIPRSLVTSGHCSAMHLSHLSPSGWCLQSCLKVAAFNFPNLTVFAGEPLSREERNTCVFKWVWWFIFGSKVEHLLTYFLWI